MDDILIVAFYNGQVGAIQELLPHARVGTVDRFQGRKLASSFPDDVAARGRAAWDGVPL